MSQTVRLIQRGDALMEAGRLEDARRIWVALIQADPQNEALWQRYIVSFPDREGQLAACDRWLARQPHSQAAHQTRLQLLSLPPAATPVESPASTSRPWLWLAAIGLFLWVGLVVVWGARQMDQLQTEYRSFVEQNQALVTAKSSLEAKVAGLTSNYHDLSSEMAAVQLEYGELLASHNSLISDYNALSGQHAALQTSYNTLQGEYETLWLNYNSAATELEFLAETAVTPPYILIENQTIYMVFYKSDYTLARWSVPFPWLEESVRKGYAARNNVFNSWQGLNLVTITGETRPVMDFRPYVDPEPFRAYVADIYYQSPSEEAFVYEMWHLVAQLTTYSYEIQETPRFPLETLLSGGGDCEDTAILLASLLKAAPIAWDVQLVYMDADNPLAPYAPNHVAVFVHSGQGKYLIETTSKRIMQPWTEGVQGWYFSVN